MFIVTEYAALTEQFIQNWNSRLNDSTRALFYRNFSFGYKTYLDFVSVGKDSK